MIFAREFCPYGFFCLLVLRQSRKTSRQKSDKNGYNGKERVPAQISHKTTEPRPAAREQPSQPADVRGSFFHRKNEQLQQKSKSR
jgi:hypothetical protein